jgi:hypothetical protein
MKSNTHLPEGSYLDDDKVGAALRSALEQWYAAQEDIDVDASDVKASFFWKPQTGEFGIEITVDGTPEAFAFGDGPTEAIDSFIDLRWTEVEEEEHPLEFWCPSDPRQRKDD